MGGSALILVAVDPHKAGHAVAVVEVSTGRLLGERDVSNDESGLRELLRWSRTLGRERVFALEDARGVTGRLERGLLTTGHTVIRVAPRLTASARARDVAPAKSDRADARSVARAVLERGIDAFPRATINETAAEVRVLADYRAALVTERTRIQNRLRWLLFALDPELEAHIHRGGLTRHGRSFRAATQALTAMPSTARISVARAELARIEQINETERGLTSALARMVGRVCPRLLEIPGCGVISAATLIGHVPDARRYPTDGHFARLAGVAPIVRGSGESERHRMDHGGDRQINAALHTIAVIQRACHAPARAYFERKRSEGKSSMHARRCLKRQIARRVWQTLKTAKLDPPPAHQHAWTPPSSTHPAPALPCSADGPAFTAALRERVLARMAELEPLVHEYEETQEVAELLRNALEPPT